MRRLIVTADDFGLSLPVNEAVEEAHRRGILSTTSLMVRAGATADAVERAKCLPSLKVGLHLVLVDGSSILSPQEIPDLVDWRGQFHSHLVRAGINFFLRPGVRRQLEAEIKAQFKAFRETGLYLDHVNCHHHLHLHPTISGLILKVGKDYGIKAMRLPYEPFIPLWRASREVLIRRITKWLLLLPWIILLKKRLKLAKVHSNNFLFGLNDNGNIHLDLFLRFIRYLPRGVTEIYFHPGENPKELEALTSLKTRQTLLALGIQTIAFGDL